MPHVNPDFIVPGEQLEVGEVLSAGAGRFRLFLEPDGRLVAYAYRADGGVLRYWSSRAVGSNARLGFTEVSGIPDGKCPAAVLSSDGGSVDLYASYGHRTDYWKSHIFVLQNGGNIVFYIQGLGVNKVAWASPPYTYEWWDSQLVVPPNVPVTDFSEVGDLILGPGQGDLGVVNAGQNAVAVQCDNRVYELPPGVEVSVQRAGIVTTVTTSTYGLADLQAPDGTPLNIRQSSNAIPPGTGRVVLELGLGAMRIKGAVGGSSCEDDDTPLVGEDFDEEPEK